MTGDPDRYRITLDDVDDERFRRFDEFFDDGLEYRRLFSEAWGTFLLVLVAAGAPVVGSFPWGSDITLFMKVFAPGLMVLGVIYFMGPVSGAHLNPAVTWAFTLRGNFPWRRVPGYLVAQAVGAFAAAGCLQLLFDRVLPGASHLGPGIEPGKGAVVEAILTLALVSVILGTSTGARNIGHNSAIAVGFYIGLAGMWAAPVTGASMNPIRSLAPAAVGGDLSSIWVWIVGPMVGATVAVGFEWILRGRPTPSGAAAAQGTLGGKDPQAL
jgi:aquaporin Z